MVSLPYCQDQQEQQLLVNVCQFFHMLYALTGPIPTPLLGGKELHVNECMYSTKPAKLPNHNYHKYSQKMLIDLRVVFIAKTFTTATCVLKPRLRILSVSLSNQCLLLDSFFQSITKKSLTKSREICECDYLAPHTSVYIETAQGKTQNFPNKKERMITFCYCIQVYIQSCVFFTACSFSLKKKKVA